MGVQILLFANGDRIDSEVWERLYAESLVLLRNFPAPLMRLSPEIRFCRRPRTSPAWLILSSGSARRGLKTPFRWISGCARQTNRGLRSRGCFWCKASLRLQRGIHELARLHVLGAIRIHRVEEDVGVNALHGGSSLPGVAPEQP